MTLELTTGAASLIGGMLLAIAPDGSLLHADSAALAESPFVDWRLPGTLLAGLVGFEVAELAWLGFHHLEAVFAAVGMGIYGLARAAG